MMIRDNSIATGMGAILYRSVGVGSYNAIILSSDADE